ncbi:SPOR domain-containing protein [Hydrogenophaga sp.]|uniref:SPOR domain-containing protein n=1 Tax=Hydrogenophaga sp. TaxID=1904254 RepID=UPI00286E9003|nr:SPOR domain-containing protein [Hydrogenophaga sp.]
MFTSRSASQGNASATPPQSIEAVRRRARHRLIGAAVLVLLGVVGFSLLFDTQPRPLPVDIPIVIPAKNTPSSLPAPKAKAPAAEPTPAAAPTTTARVAASDSLGPREEVVEPVATSKAVAPAKVEAKSEPKAETKPKAEVLAKVEPPKPAAKPAVSDADRARALLEGKTADKADAASQRIVVQVGAFADAARARDARLKLERAGLKTYTHVAETADGKRIRVRVGPYATKAEADKAAARVKALGLPAAILTL